MNARIPVDILEKRAADQRRELHNTVSELRQTVRERLDLKRNVRDHLWPVAGAMALLGLVLGYSLTDVFTGE
jgi:hypothetical protein